MAVKLHFTTDKYDVFETKGQVKGSRDVFNSRNDHYLFEKLARKFDKDFDLIQYYVANFAYGNDTAIYGNSEAEELYSEWQRRKQSITKIFADDIQKIVDNKCKDILQLYLQNKITIETAAILNDFDNFVARAREFGDMGTGALNLMLFEFSTSLLVAAPARNPPLEIFLLAAKSCKKLDRVLVM